MLNPESSPIERRVLLSGASGMLGTALTTSLLSAGYTPIRLVRRAPGSPNELEWNPAARKSMTDTEPLEGLQAAIHLSGANIAQGRWTAARREELLTSRLDTTQALVRALTSLRRPPAVLLTASATGFYGDRGSQMLDETAPAGEGFLATLCRQWEAAAQPAAQAGIRLVALRTGVVLAREEGALARMLPLFRLGLGGRLGSGHQWMSWIALDDLVVAVLFLMENPAISGPVNLTAPSPVTNQQFTSALAMRLGRPAILPAPAFALRLALGQMADEALLASVRVYPARLSAAGFCFALPTLSRALAALLG